MTKYDRLKKVLNKLLLTAVFGFAIYSNVRVIIQNYHLRQIIDEAKQGVEKEELTQKKLALLLSYYESPSYQEVEARRRLGVKKPDELAFTVKGLPPEESISLTTPDLPAETPAPAAPTSSNLSRWFEFFSGRR